MDSDAKTPSTMRVLMASCEHTEPGGFRAHVTERELAEARAAYEELISARTERDELHRIVRNCLDALGNGSGASERATITFLAKAPAEVGAEVQYLKEENKKLTAVIDKMRTYAVVGHVYDPVTLQLQLDDAKARLRDLTGPLTDAKLEEIRNSHAENPHEHCRDVPVLLAALKAAGR